MPVLCVSTCKAFSSTVTCSLTFPTFSATSTVGITIHVQNDAGLNELGETLFCYFDLVGTNRKVRQSVIALRRRS